MQTCCKYINYGGFTCMVKKGVVLAICAVLLSNTVAWGSLEAQAAIRDEVVDVKQLQENPFEDDQAKPSSNMTMKEKLAQLKAYLSGKVYDLSAAAAYVGRKKYGAKKMPSTPKKGQVKNTTKKGSK